MIAKRAAAFVIASLFAAEAAAAPADSSASEVYVSLKNGRPRFSTADGAFTFALRALVQFDSAYYAQGRTPPGIDFSSGSNFRRARFGFDGTAGKDWSYEFIYDFGGAGTETPSISSAYLQYDGLAPVHVRLGAYAPPENFEDSTSASDLVFLERAQPADVARGIAGADGRDAATVFAYDDRAFAALSYTGGMVGDSNSFDEQQALVGRAAYRAIATADANLAFSVDTSYVFKLADAAPGNSATTFRLRERPELNEDAQGIRLVDTGALAADKVWEWGAEAAGNWKSLYAQGGWFGYRIVPDAAANFGFHGWYAQASWVLTGEARSYRADRAAYASPVPTNRFVPGHGWGAWEIAARYSVLDLDDRAGSANAALPIGGVRGGEQRIWTAGLNWYPNPILRMQLDYQHTDVSRLSAAGGDAGAKLDAVSLRAQFAL